jgi:phosphoenolpyruvate---glycerone phosphotransferase subunit DhaK
MKKLINAPDNLVDEALAGMLAAHPGYLRVEEPNIVVRKDAPKAGKVGIISGGGSGHEPMHGGFVGRGMLDAACPGAVFTSPVPDQMLAATKAVDGGAGVLHIVKNYTGDIMNFELAAELARAEGLEVSAVVIADDVAVKDSLYTAGRRGDRGRRRPGRHHRPVPEGPGQRAVDGHGAHELHGARRRQAHLRHRR